MILLAFGSRNMGMPNLHNGKDLEEVVLRKVLVGVVWVQSPPVVDVEVEDAENKHQHDRRELGLEANNNHNTGNEAEQASHDSPETPVAAENEANEKKDEQNTSSKLEIHLLVLLVELRKTGRGELLAHPRIGKDHHETTHNRKVAQEEVQVKDQAVSNTLHNHHAHKTSYGVFRVLSCDNHDRAYSHCDYVDDEECVGESVPNCGAKNVSSYSSRAVGFAGPCTLSVVVEVRELVAPLCQNAQRILQESDNDQEAADSWKVPIQNYVSSVVTIKELNDVAILRCGLPELQ